MREKSPRFSVPAGAKHVYLNLGFLHAGISFMFLISPG